MDRLLEIEEAAVPSFDRTPFYIRHHLAGHPLFSLERLLKLSRGLRGDQAEFYSGDVPVYTSPEQTPSTGLSLQETIRRIESCGAWVVLKNVEQDPEYRSLLDQCLDEVPDVYGSSLRGSPEPLGFISILSAKAVTPCHVDHEHNFLLPIRGSKPLHGDQRQLLTD